MTPIARRAVALALALAGAAAAAAPAQERFSERLAVTEVEVPVRVLVQGDPLEGLTREDFVLLDRGEPQEILGFEARTLAGPGSARAPAVLPIEAPAAVARGRRLLLLFDFSSARRGRLARALDELRESLPGLVGGDDRVAVATYGNLSGLSLLVGFTTDRALVERAFDVVEAALDAKGQRQRDLLADLHEARFGDAGSTFEALRRELGATAALAVLSGEVVYDESEDDGVQIERQESLFGPIKVRVDPDRSEPILAMQDALAGVSGVRALALSLTELAYLLRELPGPKELLLLSEGFGGPLLRDARALFYLEKALEAFRSGGWVVHAVDTKGLAGLGESNFSADSLLLLADATGGELVETSNDIGRAAERVLARTRIVYLLTFQPSGAGERGEFRKLEVTLRDKIRGAKIYHRPGYYARKPPARREIFERRVDGAEWLLANLEAAELEAELRADLVRDPMGGVRVPVAVEVGGRSITAGNPGRSTRIEVQLTATDAGGALRGLVHGETVVQPRRDGSLRGAGGLRFEGDLEVPPGEYRLRLLVRSHRGGEVFLRGYPLTVSAEEGAASGLPPVVERDESAWITVPLESRSAYFR